VSDNQRHLLLPFKNKIALGKKVSDWSYSILWVDPVIDMYYIMITEYWHDNISYHGNDRDWARHFFNPLTPDEIVKYRLGK
jgi:hypothetical protein